MQTLPYILIPLNSYLSSYSLTINFFTLFIFLISYYFFYFLTNSLTFQNALLLPPSLSPHFPLLHTIYACCLSFSSFFFSSSSPLLSLTPTTSMSPKSSFKLQYVSPAFVPNLLTISYKPVASILCSSLSNQYCISSSLSPCPIILQPQSPSIYFLAVFQNV